MTPRRSNPRTLRLAKVICLLPGGGDRGLSYQPISPPGRGDAMRGNARHPVRNPAPLPASPCSPAVSRPMKLMEHLSLLFFFSPPDPFLVLNKNHLDAKVTHITRSEVPPAVTLSWHFLTHRQPARPDPSTSRRFWCLGQCRSLVFFFLAPACFPRRRQPRGEPVPIVPLSRPAGQAHISRSPSGGPPPPTSIPSCLSSMSIRDGARWRDGQP